ncbi:hypothetical protein RCL1_004874 [Eukaryota sp. TZLM3-RCL]
MTHRFWSTQPVPQGEVSEEGPISIPSIVSTNPLPLPPSFEWTVVDIHNEQQLQSLYELLSNHYVEDDDSCFRFNYSPQFLLWALTVPNYLSQWHLGVRKKDTGELLAFIAAIPQNLNVNSQIISMVSINFLCINSILRSKRLAPVLIKEITRRVNLEGIFQATYTAGINIPTPFSEAQYFHRPINIKKLVETDFLMLPADKVRIKHKIYNSIPVSQGVSMRAMTSNDVDSVFEILTQYLAKFAVHPVFSREEVAHYFLPRPRVVSSFVIVDSQDHVTDFISYYHLPSSVLRAEKEENSMLYAGYIYYYAQSKTPIKDLINSMLTVAREEGIDVVNCLSIMDNQSFLSDCMFGPGDGNLHYYLFNWKLKPVKDTQVALVLQ